METHWVQRFLGSIECYSQGNIKSIYTYIIHKYKYWYKKESKHEEITFNFVKLPKAVTSYGYVQYNKLIHMKIPIELTFCTIWKFKSPYDCCVMITAIYNIADASAFASRRVDCRTTNWPAAGVPITSDTDTLWNWSQIIWLAWYIILLYVFECNIV